MTTKTAPPQPEQARRDTLRKLRHALRRTEDRQAVTKLKDAFHDAERPGYRRVAMSARLMKLRMSLDDLHRATEPKTVRAKPATAAPMPVPEPAPIPEPAPKKVHRSKFAELNLGDAALLLAMNAVDDTPPRTVTPDPVQEPTRDDEASAAPPASADDIADHEDAGVFDHAPQATEARTAAQPGYMPDLTVADAQPEQTRRPEAPFPAEVATAESEQSGQAHSGPGGALLPVSSVTVAGHDAAPQTMGAAPDAATPDLDWPGTTVRVDTPAAPPPRAPSPKPDETLSMEQRRQTDPHPTPASASLPLPLPIEPDMRAAAGTSASRTIASLDGPTPKVAADRAGAATRPKTEDLAAPQDGPVVDKHVPQRATATPEASETRADRNTETDTTPRGVQPDPATVPGALAGNRPIFASGALVEQRGAETRHVRPDPPAHGQALVDDARNTDNPVVPVTVPEAQPRHAARAAVYGTDPTPIPETAANDDLETKVFKKPKKGTAMVNLDAMAALAAFTAASPTGLRGSTDGTGDD